MAESGEFLMNQRAHWERQADNWLQWARTPGFDSYWYYRQAFLEGIVPSPRGRALEVGCGEGRVARDLIQRGHHVVGLDCCPLLIQKAAEATPHSSFVRAEAGCLPFKDASFSLVVAYNCLMDFDDMPRAVAEASRVLEPRGHFALCITHPFKDAGAFASAEPDAPFIIKGSYLGNPRRFDEVCRRDGLEMHFRGWLRSLEDYSQALEAGGFAIERMREPAAADESIRRFGKADRRWKRLPLFLMLRAVKTG
jgi:SAM-dependent methyltransferase